MDQLHFIDIATVPKLVFDHHGKRTILVDFHCNLTEHPNHVYVYFLVPLLSALWQNNFEESAFSYADKLSEMDITVIIASLVNYLLTTSGKNISMLEIGTKMGYTAHFEAQILKTFSMSNKLYCAGSWSLPSELPSETISKKHEMASHDQFLIAMKKFNVMEQIITISNYNTYDLKGLQPHYFDCIFLNEKDGNAVYDLVEIIIRIKPGGLLIWRGDDEVFTQGMIDALSALFGDTIQRPVELSAIWTKIITLEERKQILDRYSFVLERTTVQKLIKTGEIIERDLRMLEGLIPTMRTRQIKPIVQRLGKSISFIETATCSLPHLISEMKVMVIELKEFYAECLFFEHRDYQEITYNDIKELIRITKMWMILLSDYQTTLRL